MREAVNPRQAVLATSRGKADILGKETLKDNIITLSWHSPLSLDPELYGICVGKTRFSCKLLKDSKVFAVNFMAHEFKDQVLQCGMLTGAAADKFAKTGLTKEDCDTIDCCRIKEASAVLECEVIEEVETGDHILFIGKVSKTINRDDRKRLISLGGSRFTTTI
ncbi:flavin reductase family protein [Candidatus Woesearchaeota archaeon]|nr:flavin reductase family protein [Candidatus Woesearchaeota archaeon]